LTEALKQGQFSTMSLGEEVVALYAATLIDELPTPDVRRFESELIAYMHEHYEDTLTDITQTQQLSDAAKATLDEAIEKFKGSFRASE